MFPLVFHLLFAGPFLLRDASVGERFDRFRVREAERPPVMPGQVQFAPLGVPGAFALALLLHVQPRAPVVVSAFAKTPLVSASLASVARGNPRSVLAL